MGREPNALELAVFSLMWSEHCAYKHSKKLLRPAAHRGPAPPHGAGRERRRRGRGRRAGGGLQGRVAQPPERGGALPGRGHRRRRHPARHLRGRRAADRGARLAPLRRARLAALALPVRLAPSRASATTATRSACRPSGGEVYFESAYEQNCLVNAMCVGLARARAADPQRGRRRGQPARAARRAHRARRDRRGVGARERGAVRGGRVQAPERCRSATRSRSRSSWSAASSCSSAGCCASLQDLGAAGLSSQLLRDGVEGRGRPRHRRGARAAARGGHGAVRGHDLRVAGADAVRGGAGAAGGRARRCARAGRCGQRPIGEVTDTRRLRVFDGDELVGDMPVEALVDDVPALRPRARGAGRRPSTRIRPRSWSPGARCGDTLLALLAVAEHRVEALRVRAVRLDRGLAHDRGGRSPPTPPCWCSAADGRSGRARRVDRRERAARGLRPLHGRGRGGARVRRATSPAWAPSRSASPTASTSATPRSRTSRGSSRASVEGLRDACLALGVPVVGGNVSLYNEGGGRADLPDAGRGDGGQAARARPRCPAPASRRRGTRSRSWGCSSRRSRARSSRSCAAASRARSRRSISRRTRTRSCACGRPSGAGRFATAHDISTGGLACALAECCIEGGLGARVALRRAATLPSSARARAASSSPARARRSRRCGGATVIGEVGGDALTIDGALTVPVSDLREAYEGAIPAAFAA